MSAHVQSVQSGEHWVWWADGSSLGTLGLVGWMSGDTVVGKMPSRPDFDLWAKLITSKYR